MFHGVFSCWSALSFSSSVFFSSSVLRAATRCGPSVRLLPEGERVAESESTREIVLYGDTLDFWHRMASRVRCILRAKAALDVGDMPEEEDWETLFGAGSMKSLRQWQCPPQTTRFRPSPDPQTKIEYARIELFSAVNLWSSRITMRLTPSWAEGSTDPVMVFALPHAISDNGWSYDRYNKYRGSWKNSAQHNDLYADSLYYDEDRYYPMRPSHLFHVLVLQLLSAMRQSVVSCSVCGGPILNYKRRSRSLCEVHRKASAVIRQTEYRKRKRQNAPAGQ